MSDHEAASKPKKRPVNIYGIVAGKSAVNARKVLLLWLVFAIAAMAVTTWRLKINTDPGKMISQELDFRKSFVDFTHAFPAIDNNFLVVVESDNPDLAREASRSLVASFSTQKELFSHVYAPGLGEFFDKYGILYMPEADIAAIVEKVKASRQVLAILSAAPNLDGFARVLERLMPAIEAGQAPDALAGLLREAKWTVTERVKKNARPLDWSSIVTGGVGQAPTVWYISVRPVLDFSLIDPSEAALNAARQIISDPEVLRSGKVRISLTGEAALNGEEFQSVTQGAVLAGTVSFVLVIFVIWLGLPVTRLIVPAVGLLVFGFMVNMGFATLAVGSLNMISVAFAVLFIGLGIDYAIHSVLRYWEETVRGRDKLAAIAAGAHHAGPALALCTLTTSLAFLAFVPSDFVGMAQLGIIAAGGIVIAFVASMTLIPAILAVMNIVPQEKHLTGKNWMPHTVWQHVRLGTTVFTIMVALAALVLLPDVRFDGDPVNLKDPKAPSVQAFLRVLKQQPGEAYAAQVIAPSAEEAEILVEKLEKLPTVRRVRWVASFLPDRQAEKLARLRTLRGLLPDTTKREPEQSAEARLASVKRLEAVLLKIEQAAKLKTETRQEAASLRRALVVLKLASPVNDKTLKLLERDMFLQFPGLLAQLKLMSVTQPFDVHNFDADVQKRYVTGDGRWRLEVVPRGDMSSEMALRQFVADVRKVAPNATGSPVEIVGAADVVAKSMRLATLIALGLVLIILVPVLRSPVSIGLVLAPLVLSALLLLAYTVIFKAPFNFANVIVLPLLLGLGVDSAIHYVMRAREDGLKRQVVDTTTPRAVLISALTTIGSFGTLWLSPHKGTSSMGELLTVAIIITLITTLVVLPQFIAWTIGRKATRGPIDRSNEKA